MVLSLITTVIAIAVGVHVYAVATRSSYSEGYQWGQANTIGYLSKTAPSCSRSEMASSRAITDPNFAYNKPIGNGLPNGNFAQWQAGCEAGAKSVIASFNSSEG